MQESSADWLKKLKADKIMGEAERIMKSAVDVLEEEIAAGILAAKKLEKTVLERDGEVELDHNDLMNRVRTDLHSAVDLIMDSVVAMRSQFGALADKLTQGESTSIGQAATASASCGQGIPVVQNEEPAKSGRAIEIPILLRNAGEAKQIILGFSIPDLQGPLGKKIAAKQIQVAPSTLMIEPGTAAEIKVSIHIPKACKPGSYSGLLHDPANADVRIVLIVEVT